MEEVMRVVPTPPTGPLEKALERLTGLAQCVAIANVGQHEAALRLRRDVTAFRREVAALLDPAIALQHQAHKAGLAAKAKLDRPAELLEQSIDRACRDFERQQERIADEQERLLQEQARREEEDRILAEAQLAQDIGDPAAAEAIVAEPVAPAIVHVAPRVAQVEGVTRRNLPAKAVVYDKRAFIKYVAEHPELDDCLEATPKLNALARAMGTNMKIPGVRVVVETTTAVKAS